LKIRQLAKDKEMAVLLLPRYNDLLRYKATEKSPLFEDLSNRLIGHHIELVDLLPEFYNGREDDLHSLFLPCDGHWAPVGHQKAAEVIQEKLRDTFY